MMRSWISILDNSDFSIYNIPFGIFSHGNSDPRPATRIGDTVVDLSVLADFGYFDDLGIDDLTVFYQPYLNEFIALGKLVTSKVRNRLGELFLETNDDLKANQEACALALHPIESVTMHMPVKVGNYTDFYASEQHAYNVGVMFRDPKNALLPNWKHLPVGYHGRASSIVVSGTPIYRPSGQTKADDQESPVFGPSGQLDFELEIGFVIGRNSELGSSIKTSETEEYIFGLVLFNDLSARDIQKWEYVPLGPFLSKNFGSVISPWIVTLEAVEPFRTPGPLQLPKVLPYLQYDGSKHFDINLEVFIEPGSQRSAVSGQRSVNDNRQSTILSISNLKYLYWNFSQMLAHHTVNGCNVEVGDICASGTISGPGEDSFGSMLELAWKGTKPITMPDGSKRSFIEDYDSVVMHGYGEKNGVRVGFGECRMQILPAK
ncbi:MAG: fumarylacetoacetase [Bacteroidales bacterium]|nr:fumarylacetoacetase [Bacteroidales bacterium]